MTPTPDAEARQQRAMEEVRRNNPRFVVTVFVPTSFLAAPETPTTIFRELHGYLAGRYAVVGAVVRVGPADGQPSRLQLVTGRPVSDAFQANPMWYDTRNRWAAALVWRRLEASEAPTPTP
jgi:hypothetical protein